MDLKSGGYLIIDQTEALTTVDVNTGGFVGGRNFDDTIFKTNLEAAQAIARQLRLRNLGGIVILDFIDMEEQEHRDTVLAELKKALSRDRTRMTVNGFTQLGLVEMTRKRTRDSLAHQLCEPCPMCEARGNVRTPRTVCYEILREILREARQFNPRSSASSPRRKWWISSWKRKASTWPCWEISWASACRWKWKARIRKRSTTSSWFDIWPDGSPGSAYRIRNPVAVRTASAGRARHRTPHADEPASASSTEHMPHPRTPPQESPMNLPSPVIAAHPPSRPRAGTASWPCASARSPPASSTISCAAPARASLALILNGNTEAGAAKLAAYAFIAGGIQSFLMRLSPRLGFMALLCSTLTLLGVLVAWNLLPRIADGLPYAGAALGWLALAGLTYAGWRRGAHRADLGRAGATASLAISVLALLLAVWVLVLRPLVF